MSLTSRKQKRCLARTCQSSHPHTRSCVHRLSRRGGSTPCVEAVDAGQAALGLVAAGYAQLLGVHRGGQPLRGAQVGSEGHRAGAHILRAGDLHRRHAVLAVLLMRPHTMSLHAQVQSRNAMNAPGP